MLCRQFGVEQVVLPIILNIKQTMTNFNDKLPNNYELSQTTLESLNQLVNLRHRTTKPLKRLRNLSSTPKTIQTPKT